MEKKEDQEIPENWPTNLTYLPSLSWEGVPNEIKQKFMQQDDSPSQWVQLFIETDTSALFVCAKSDFQVGVWLGEITGEVKRKEEISDSRFSVGYFADASSIYCIDTREFGNEFKFVRKENENRKANVRFQQLWIDGRLGVFVEVIEEIKENEEIIAELQNEIYGIQKDGIFGEETATNYLWTNKLSYKKLPKPERRRFSKARALTEWAAIKIVSDPKHPCFGQLGLFSKCKLGTNMYLGEYTGKVFVEMVESVYKSKYLVDYSNPGVEGLEMVVADGGEHGNETRFINDMRNTGKEANVRMKRMWVGGMMRPFVQLIAPVDEGEEFLTDYGEKYWEIFHV